MLAEYALIPDIFSCTSYSSEEVCRIRIQNIKDVLLNEALVRDLRDGEWSKHISNHISRWPPCVKELLKKLHRDNRLRKSPPGIGSPPCNNHEWCEEALASHDISSLNGIITSSSEANNYKEVTEIASIEKLSSASWWQKRSESVRLARTVNDYLKHLNLILKHATSIMFIDPHIDPSRPNYKNFYRLLVSAKRDKCSPLIEIHRVCYRGSGPSRRVIPNNEWVSIFQNNLSKLLASINLRANIFIWDDFHDRYLITKIFGISMPYGFAESRNQTQKTSWSRLSRIDREDVEREFDEPAKRHTLRIRFTIP